ncbi:methionine ABC transporter ATP-binding protein [Streptomyces lavendulae]|uniref:Methionine import ATP-binding protein MetN 2 n=1 Tax=Streptomyces lavendulae subsp. lavendulae TaxID=58340 RepID=A0A2K8PQ17_STRLA|nr:ATP-binding cassette domain-containing protein [Streptomyces lavendulae]ATZ28558.1 Methionine import ATP-binding protein MetN 2 [Streptomyces lavendulae subsp. lavendulae]QUQ58383.1 Methionine import ATP-binding protein MetN 2 [Streptomyces lavendulae subsp. lavendulae]
MTAAIELRGVRKEFPGGAVAVDDVSLTVGAGSVFGVVGHSGAGKSTLLRLVNGLEEPTAGSVLLDGQDLAALGERRLRPVRRDIGMIFQQFNLFRSRTVLGNVTYPLRLAGLDRAAARARAEETLDFVGLAGHGKRYPEQLSGGQRQRVGIARALATRPKVLLCDEATSALDPQTTGEVLALLRRVNRELGVTILLITHEMEVVRTLCDRVAVMEDGRVVESGEVYEVFARPAHPTTAAFVRSALHGEPDGPLLERLRARHPGRLVTVPVVDGAAVLDDLSPLLRENGVDFTLVHGGVAEVRGRPLGSVTLALRGGDAAVEAVVRGLAAPAQREAGVR